METAIETVARIIFEDWGGPWVTAPEFRRAQARREALTVLDGLRKDEVARAEVVAFLTSKDMGDLSSA